MMPDPRASIVPAGPGAGFRRFIETYQAVRGSRPGERIRDGDAQLCCPAHEDREPSLHVTRGPASALLQCFAGCPAEAVVAAIGLTMSDLFDSPPSSANGERGRSYRHLVERYPYVDENGALLFEVERLRDDHGRKRFRQRRPDPSARGGYRYSLNGVRRVLYRLPQVLEAVAAGRECWICEGEKDAHALERAGVTATCNPGGAGKWRPEYAEVLRGAEVVIVADRDAPGVAHALDVARSLEDVGARVRLTRAAQGKDAADHLGAGLGLEAFAEVTAAELADEAPAKSVPLRVIHGGGGGGPGGGDTDAGPERFPVPGHPEWFYGPGVGVWKSAVQVLDWCPRVLEHLTVPGDATGPRPRHFSLRVGAEDATTSAVELRSGDVWDRFAAAAGAAAKTLRDVLAAAVTDQARRLEPVRVVDRSGWHLLDGQAVWMGPDGRGRPAEGSLRLVNMPERTRQSAAQAPSPQSLTPSSGADRSTVAAALELVAGAGPVSCAPLLALGAGARSLGYSLAPARTGLVLVGRARSGKTCSADVARLLVFGPEWPPVATAAFADTRTAIELSIDREGDVPVLVDDLALTPDAPDSDVREALGKLEHVLRAAGNATAMRRRSSKELLERRGYEVRSIPILTAESLPATMAESLLRRSVVVELRPDDVTLGALEAAWRPQLWPALHAVGDAIIGRLAGLGAEEAGEVLRAADARWATELGRTLERVAPERERGADGLVSGAACLLAGLELVAVAAGLEPDALAGRALEPLAAHLARQAERMADRNSAAADMAEAVGEVLGAALFERRAHVCSGEGDYAGEPYPAVPGYVAQSQGLRQASGVGGLREWLGDGVPVYWLESQQALGVRSADLHLLARRAKDGRLGGFTPRSLPRALLQAGALVPSPQKGRDASWQVRIGRDTPRLVLVRASLVFPGLEDGPSGPVGADTGPAPTPAPGDAQGPPGGGPAALADGLGGRVGALSDEAFAVLARRIEAAGWGPAEEVVPHDLDAEQLATLAAWVAAAETLFEPTPPDDPPAGPDGSPAPAEDDRAASEAEAAPQSRAVGEPATSGPPPAPPAGPVPPTPPSPTSLAARQAAARATMARTVGGMARGRQRDATRGAAGPVVVTAADGRLVAERADERWVIDPPGNVAGLAELAYTSAAGPLWVMPPARAALGLPATPPRDDEAGEVGFFAAPAGWDLRYRAGRVTGWSLTDRAALVRIVFAGWNLADPFATLGDPAEAAAALEVFEAAHGTAWTGSGGATFRDLTGRALDQLGPSVQPNVTLEGSAATGEGHGFAWDRAPTADERRGRWHGFDRNGSFIAGLGDVAVGVGAPEWHGRGVFAPKDRRPGWWLVITPDGLEARLPCPLTPTGRHPQPGARCWVTTPSAVYLADTLGLEVRFEHAWVWADSGRPFRAVQAQLRAARATLTDSPDPAAEVAYEAHKLTYSEGINNLRATYHTRSLSPAGGGLTEGPPGWQPYAQAAIVATSRTNTLRRLVKVAQASGRHPVAVREVDEVVYAGPEDDPAAAAETLGLPLGTGLGQFKPKWSMPAPPEPAGGWSERAVLSAVADRLRSQNHQGGQ